MRAPRSVPQVTLLVAIGAAVLVGAGSGPAAAAFIFQRRVEGIPVTDGTVIPEPFTGGLNSPKPHLADLDGDGDLDLLIVQPGGGITRYRNIGSRTSFVFRFAADNMQGINARTWATLADIDADGDLDLFTDGNGSVVLYRNVGSPAAPVWQFETSTFQGITNSGFGNTPSFVDVDGDQDLDYLEMDQNAGTARFYRNDGTPQSPSFTFVTNTFGCIDTFDPGFGPGPGQPREDGEGAAAAPGGKDPDAGQHGISVIATADIDADLDKDIFIGDLTNTNLWFFRRDPAPCAPVCTPVTVCYRKIAREYLPIETQGINQARFADLDADGDLDLLVGSTNQSAVIDNLIYFINAGTAQSAAFQVVDLNLIKAIDIGRSSHPAFGDLDGDGDKDLFLGTDDGTIVPYWNTGSATAPAFVRGAPLRDGLGAVIDVGFGAAPVWIDYEGDGDLDLFVGVGSPGRVRYYRNDGTPQAMDLRLQTTMFGNVTADFNAAPALGDLDHDSDLDLLVGEFGTTGNPRLFYVRNDGTTQNPVWTAVCDNTPNTCVFAQRVYVGDLAPALKDLDGDGDLDLLLGERDGNVNFYRNTGTQAAFNFVLESESFAGAQVGLESTPAVVDVDGDGDDDLFVGEQNGGLNYYQRVPQIGVDDPGPAAPPAAASRLLAVRPNPTAGGASATLELAAGGRLRAVIYAPDGRLVRLLADRFLAAGEHRIDWDGRDGGGTPAAAGLYLLRVDIGGETLTAKLALIR